MVTPSAMTFYQHLQTVADPRAAKGKQNSWNFLLTLLSAALAAGQRQLSEIHDWVQAHGDDLLATWADSVPRLPSYASLRRAVLRVDVQQVEAAVAAHSQQLSDASSASTPSRPAVRGSDLQGQALDGKTVRGVHLVTRQRTGWAGDVFVAGRADHHQRKPALPKRQAATQRFGQPARAWPPINVIGGLIISSRGRKIKLRLHTYRCLLTGKEVIAYLKYLLCILPGPIVLVWDHAPIHQRRVVQAFLAQHPRLHVYCLPTYAPELNPVEFVWTQVKEYLASRAPLRINDLMMLLRRALARTRRSPARLWAGVYATDLPWKR